MSESEFLLQNRPVYLFGRPVNNSPQLDDDNDDDDDYHDDDDYDDDDDDEYDNFYGAVTQYMLLKGRFNKNTSHVRVTSVFAA